jgi:hypothetical protein
MLLNDPINDITWASVEEFCRGQVPEGTTVDYKQDWPGGLEKDIAALANTLGGLLIIGVACDAQERPIVPIAGMAVEERLELRVYNVCQDAIFPPVIPEVRACLNADGTRAVIVIRVPMSRLVHAVERKTRVYVRTGNRNSHTELADLDRIQWLLDHRAALELQRGELLVRARARALPMIDSVSNARRGHYLDHHTYQRHWLEMYAVPTYPSKALIAADSPDWRALATETVRTVVINGGGDFPLTLQDPRSRAVDGGYAVACASPGSPDLFGYHEVNEYGLFYVRERIHREGPTGEPPHYLYGSLLAVRLLAFATSVCQLYEALQYLGPVELRVALLGIDGQDDLRFVAAGNHAGQNVGTHWSPDIELSVQQSVNMLSFPEQQVEFAVSAATRFHRGFGALTAGTATAIAAVVAAEARAQQG